MLTRRSMTILFAGPWLSACGLIAASTELARAFTFQRYQDGVVKRTIATGKPVIVHVYAPWCLQCRAQASILEGLAGNPQLDRVTFFKVDYDNQKDVVAALNVPRSTLIGYKDGKEVARMSWGTSQEDVVKVLQAAF